MIDPDEFDAWREHPVTRAVFAELRKIADDRRDLWAQQSWGAGVCDELLLATLRGQADGFAWLADASHEAVFGANKE